MPTSNHILLSSIRVPHAVTHSSKHHLSQIQKSLQSDPDSLFVTVASDGKKYSLIDKYDVYYAAKSIGMKRIYAHVFDSIPLDRAYILMSYREYTNPIRVVEAMRPYVEELGLDDAIQILHLEPDFKKIYQLDFEQCNKQLDEMFSAAYAAGTRSTVPYKFLHFLCSLEKPDQEKAISMINRMRQTLGSNFRWPDQTHMRGILSDSIEKKKKKPRVESTESGIQHFKCHECDKKYVVSGDRVTPYREKDGVVVIDGDESEPVFGLGKRYNKFLGTSMQKPPEVITSDFGNIVSITKRLKGRKFVIFMEPGHVGK